MHRADNQGAELLKAGVKWCAPDSQDQTTALITLQSDAVLHVQMASTKRKMRQSHLRLCAVPSVCMCTVTKARARASLPLWLFGFVLAWLGS